MGENKNEKICIMTETWEENDGIHLRELIRQMKAIHI